MARKPYGIPTASSPPATDDFGLIKGIGPVLSKRLHEAGICTYCQLASLSPTELAKKVSGLSVRLITRQDWIGQAQKLQPPKIQSKPISKDSPKRTIRQHYENFTIEFLLDEKNMTRRSRAVHVQSGDADTWAGWEPNQLIDFITRHTGIHTLAKKSEKQLHPPDSVQSSSKQIDESSIPINTSHTPIPLILDGPKLSIPSSEFADSGIELPANNNLSGRLTLRNFNIFAIDSDKPVYLLYQGQSCHVQITLDLTKVAVLTNIPLVCKANINFKLLGGASCPVVEGNNTIKPVDFVTLDLIFT